jgi:hypothetical protein
MAITDVDLYEEYQRREFLPYYDEDSVARKDPRQVAVSLAKWAIKQIEIDRRMAILNTRYGVLMTAVCHAGSHGWCGVDFTNENCECSCHVKTSA